MRVIFETPAQPMTLNHRESGKLVRGFGSLRVLLFEPDEPAPKLPGSDVTYRNPRPLSELRAEGGLDGRVIAVPGPSFRDSMAPVEIPESVLAPLGDNARLHFSWLFTPGAT
jgi:hypothetical protein